MTMIINMNIPALLFPAISLTMLAYNARYLAIAALIRQLQKEYLNSFSEIIDVQIRLLRRRLYLIRNMQAIAILSFLGAVVTMSLLYVDKNRLANFIFGLSLAALMVSLILSFIEVQLSTKALNVQLNSLEKLDKNK